MFKRLTAVNWKDVGKRVAKTFIETALGYITFDSLAGLSDAAEVKRAAATMAVSAVAAGVTAVWNILLSVFSKAIEGDAA